MNLLTFELGKKIRLQFDIFSHAENEETSFIFLKKNVYIYAV